MGLIWILILRYQIQKYLSPGSIDKIKGAISFFFLISTSKQSLY